MPRSSYLLRNRPGAVWPVFYLHERSHYRNTGTSTQPATAADRATAQNRDRRSNQDRDHAEQLLNPFWWLGDGRRSLLKAI